MPTKAKPRRPAKRDIRKSMPDPDVGPDPGYHGGFGWNPGVGLGPAATGWQFLTNPSQEQILRAYGQSPWLHIKLLRLCSAIAMLKSTVKANTRIGEDPVVLPEDYPFWKLLHNPNPVLTAYDFTFLTELYIRGTGELFWRLERTGTGSGPLSRIPKAIWPIPRFWARPNRDSLGKVVTYTLAMRGNPVVPAEDMLWLHVPNPSDPYHSGMGDVLSTATEIETFEYASEADKNFFLRDASPAGALTLPADQKVNEATRRTMRQEWARQFGGFRNYGETPLLWGGLDFKALRNTKKEMDFVEGQKFLRDVIIAGVHPHILGISQDVNRANAEAAEYTFAKYEVLPRARWHEQVWNKYIAPLFDPRAFMQYESVVPDDMDRLLKAALDPLTAEILTVDQRIALLARVVTGLKPVGGAYGGSYVQQTSRIVVSGEEVNTPSLPAGDGGGPPSSPSPTSSPSSPPSKSLVRKASLREILNALGKPEEMAKLLWRQLGPAYEQVMASRWEQASEEVGLSSAFSVTDPDVARYLRSASATRVVGIESTTRDALRETLAEGVNAGESIPELAKRVSEVFDDAKGARATLIARTETLDASNQAALEAYKDAGVSQVEWLLAPDYNPDIDNGECEPFDGMIINVGEEFAKGISAPPLHPACRCAIAPVVTEGKGVYEGEHRKRHITALGQTHLRLERMFLGAVKRGFQQYQNVVSRRLREI